MENTLDPSIVIGLVGLVIIPLLGGITLYYMIRSAIVQSRMLKPPDAKKNRMMR